jgi:dipeptidyl aminopeptidase/acylaminoacyl peptidase
VTVGQYSSLLSVGFGDPVRLKRMGVLSAAVIGIVACDVSPLAPFPTGWSPPRQYATHTEVDLGFTAADGVRLSGTLCLPNGSGPFGAVLFHNGSDRWTTRPCAEAAGFRHHGFATFTYDKRGVGRSGGKCCPLADPGYFALLAGDVRAAAEAIGARADIDPTRIGAFGFSQGGWVVPIAVASAPELFSFAIIGSGPAVTLGEELYYSDLTGDTACKPSGRSDAEVDSLLAARGPSLFNPAPYLRELRTPTLWIFGGLDKSIPVRQSIDRLAAVRDSFNLPIEIELVPDMNHQWILGGAFCQFTGNHWDDSQVIVPFLKRYFDIP